MRNERNKMNQVKKEKIEITNLKEKNKVYDTEIESITLHKGVVVAETKSSILCKVGKYKVWFNKKFVNASIYTLRLQIGIIGNFEYACEINDNESGFITGKNLIKFFKPNEMSEEVNNA